MSDDLLNTARAYLDGYDPRVTPGDRAENLAAATAHAAVDAAETLRRIEGLLVPASVEGDDGMCPNCLTPWKCNGPHEPTDAPAHAPTGTAAGDPSPPPAAGDTPQVGEVWEHKSGVQARIAEPFMGEAPGFMSVGWVHDDGSHTDPSFTWFNPAQWRRVSPAPAPLTEREVTAEAQGVEPASDEQIARIEEYVEAGFNPTRDETRALIARVRAAEARAEDLDIQLTRAKEAHHRADKSAIAMEAAQHKMFAAEKAAHEATRVDAQTVEGALAKRVRALEAQVALMEPVVRVATAPAVTAGALADAARAYREATRDA